ncbi:MAG: hypothetical protein BWY60_01093 [Actinobacteria bacterium ADurb.Bin346]|nr:MAG: hypothetical protein BWY60_01093 [Actinobacteria bacterium ADurb.Bin346]
METYNKRFNLKHLLIIIFILVIVLAIVISISQFTFRKEYQPPTALINMLPRYRVIDMDNIPIKSDKDGDGINDQKDILMGAKSQLIEPAVNIFSEGLNETNYYNGGDPPPGLAVCTDIIARAFKAAGFDIRQLVYEDIRDNFSEYPLRTLWGQTRPDKDIDYRRIQNLEIFFKRNAKALTLTFNYTSEQDLMKWLPGDIVFFDMDRDGYTDNAGIISDFTTRKGIPKIIYNYIDPGHTIESEILTTAKITGHYRWQ